VHGGAFVQHELVAGRPGDVLYSYKPPSACRFSDTERSSPPCAGCMRRPRKTLGKFGQMEEALYDMRRRRRRTGGLYTGDRTRGRGGGGDGDGEESGETGVDGCIGPRQECMDA